MKYLPAKCPITPSPEAQALIEKHDLVYVGVGSDENPLMPTFATGIGLYDSGEIDFWLDKCWNGSATGRHYFFARAEVAQYYKPARVRKLKTVYFHSPSTKAWVGKISRGVEHEYSNGCHLDTASAEVIKIVKEGLMRGTYKTLTRAEFLAALKKFGAKENGTKIAPRPNLKAKLAAARAAVETLKSL